VYVLIVEKGGFIVGVSLIVTGDYACFTRPEMKAERVSYDVMTPSAARGIMEAIYWHPGFSWVIDRITVLNPIRFDSVRRNEVSGKMSANVKPNMPKQVITDDRQQRATLLLRDVAYIIDAHFVLLPEKMAESDNEGKFLDTFNRRLTKGQCFHRPYFGCREFPVMFEPTPEERPKSAYYDEESRDLGFMLWDFDYKTIDYDRKLYEYTPRFFRAEMKRGVIDCNRGAKV
jgi:CRISPR-associated protein Cas5d